MKLYGKKHFSETLDPDQLMGHLSSKTFSPAEVETIRKNSEAHDELLPNVEIAKQVYDATCPDKLRKEVLETVLDPIRKFLKSNSIEDELVRAAHLAFCLLSSDHSLPTDFLDSLAKRRAKKQRTA
jgi:hypothetical protein